MLEMYQWHGEPTRCTLCRGQVRRGSWVQLCLRTLGVPGGRDVIVCEECCFYSQNPADGVAAMSTSSDEEDGGGSTFTAGDGGGVAGGDGPGDGGNGAPSNAAAMMAFARRRST